MQGVVARVIEDRGFAFIRTSDGLDYFAHCKDCADLEFDDTLLERRVEFNPVETEKGRRALQVRPVND